MKRRSLDHVAGLERPDEGIAYISRWCGHDGAIIAAGADAELPARR
jgi:hypothetical protein